MKECKLLFLNGYCKNTMEREGDRIYFSKCAFYQSNYSSCSNFIPDKDKPSRYISKEIRYIVLNRQHWRCNMCCKHLKYSKNHCYGDVVAHIDHIHPFSEWETYKGLDINEPFNLEALCPDCNMKKHAKNGF